MKLITATLTAAVLTASLAACGTEGSVTGPSTSATSKPAKQDDKVGIIGQDVFTWKDGLQVSVSPAGVGTIDNQFHDHKGAAVIAYKVKLVNGTDKQVKPFFTADATYGPEGESAEQVYSVATIEGTDFPSVIRVGGTATATIVFRVPKAYQDDVTLALSPDFGHDDAVFVSK